MPSGPGVPSARGPDEPPTRKRLARREDGLVMCSRNGTFFLLLLLLVTRMVTGVSQIGEELGFSVVQRPFSSRQRGSRMDAPGGSGRTREGGYANERVAGRY